MKEKEQRLLYWLWLSLATCPGTVLPTTLLKYFGDPEKIYEATPEDLEEVDTLFYGHEKDLADKSLDRAKSILTYCRKEKIGIMTPDDYIYPEGFRALPNKPMVLYYLGNFCDLDNRFTVGVVGTRHPSGYGIHAAKRISLDLARAGAVIVSGVAMGCDTFAHKAALYNKSFTVGILGCGIDRVYPEENAELYEQIIREGLLITEYPPGTPPYGKNFPKRNRLIAALSDTVCVIEGDERSGALITAEDAMKQKKTVYAVPGSIFSRSALGSNFLLKMGAKPCLSAYDIVEDFRPLYPGLKSALPLFGKKESVPEPKKEKRPKIRQKLRSFVFPGSQRSEEEKAIPPEFEVSFIEGEKKEEEKTVSSLASPLPTLSEEEREIYIALGYEPMSSDALVTQDRSVSKVLQILTKLEIKGLVRKAPGGKYILTDRAEV